MSNYKQLKSVKKQRLNSKAGHRRRGKNKKSVAEKRRLRLLGQDTLLNENFHSQQQKQREITYQL